MTWRFSISRRAITPGPNRSINKRSKSAESRWAPSTTKAALLQVQSPYILHLATHGFFEPEQQPDTKLLEQLPVNLERSLTRSKFFQNPMYRNGVALARAQSP